MSPVNAGREKRRGLRIQDGRNLNWKLQGIPEPRSGFLIEKSEDGLAFGWRGEELPIVGSLVELHVAGGWGSEKNQRGIIRHSSVAHEGLCVVGVEKYRARPFPPGAVEHAEVKVRSVLADGEPLRSYGCGPIFSRRTS
jgi:hypothetical protein